MIAEYHVRITTEALHHLLGPGSLAAIVRANLGQDRPDRLVGHPEIHCDDSAFAATERYIAHERALAVRASSAGDRPAALRALGRLLHSRQDFYAHSNWVAIWAAQHGGVAQCEAQDVDLCTDPLAVPGLISGRGNVFEYLAVRAPLAGRLYRRFLLPNTSHEAMNLDDPSRGPLFPFAVAAATRHSRLELDLLLQAIEQVAGADAGAFFLGSRPTKPDDHHHPQARP